MDGYIKYENHKDYINLLPLIFQKDVKTIYREINWHENIELLRMRQGEAEVLYGNNRVFLYPDEIMIINSNVLHNVFSSSPILYDYLIIDNSFAEYNGIDVTAVSFVNKIHNDIKLEMLFESVSENYFGSGPFQKLKVCESLLRLLVYICNNYVTDKPADKYNDDIIKTAITYINENIAEKLSVAEIASSVGTSKYHFIRKFKEYAGYTPIEYINIHRCGCAKALLRERKYTINQIAHMCGFDTPSYFSEVFRKVTGKRPSDYIND